MCSRPIQWLGGEIRPSTSRCKRCHATLAVLSTPRPLLLSSKQKHSQVVGGGPVRSIDSCGAVSMEMYSECLNGSGTCRCRGRWADQPAFVAGWCQPYTARTWAVGGGKRAGSPALNHLKLCRVVLLPQQELES